ncbi:hypothetical protein [Chryseobacterium sp.]|uniref:hypothetical protein n=1 Tax=Chryseobacterium sp. TaxID=1871047 RepID=UPI0025BCC248|nr:hypothetical protein [Chryseobacterium sp.]
MSEIISKNKVRTIQGNNKRRYFGLAVKVQFFCYLFTCLLFSSQIPDSGNAKKNQVNEQSETIQKSKYSSEAYITIQEGTLISGLENIKKTNTQLRIVYTFDKKKLPVAKNVKVAKKIKTVKTDVPEKQKVYKQPVFNKGFYDVRIVSELFISQAIINNDRSNHVNGFNLNLADKYTLGFKYIIYCKNESGYLTKILTPQVLVLYSPRAPPLI